MTSNTQTGTRGPVANSRTVLGKIRNMLREEPVLERELIRERLRAMRRIAQDEFGGRRVYLLIHYLRRRGEITTTPTHIMAASLLPPQPRKPAPRRGPEGFRSRRIRLAAKRARAVARRGGRRKISRSAQTRQAPSVDF